jgi:hypothetical protein
MTPGLAPSAWRAADIAGCRVLPADLHGKGKLGSLPLRAILRAYLAVSP